MRLTTPTLRLPAAALALACLTLGPAAAQDPLRDFHELGDFALELDGVERPLAKIYGARNPPAILVIASELESPIVLHPRSGQVQTVHLMKMVESDHGLDLLGGWALEELAPFSVTDGGTVVTFSAYGRIGKVKPKPPLVGLQPTAALRDYSPEYARLQNEYEPSKPILDRLRSQDKPVRVRVFFGTWCPFCGEMVPRAMRVADELNGANITFEFYGLPRTFSGEPQADRYDVSSVPTGIVFVDGKEVGRITGNSWKVPEMALNNLLVGS